MSKTAEWNLHRQISPAHNKAYNNIKISHISTKHTPVARFYYQLYEFKFSLPRNLITSFTSASFFWKKWQRKDKFGLCSYVRSTTKALCSPALEDIAWSQRKSSFHAHLRGEQHRTGMPDLAFSLLFSVSFACASNLLHSTPCYFWKPNTTTTPE